MASDEMVIENSHAELLGGSHVTGPDRKGGWVGGEGGNIELESLLVLMQLVVSM